MAWRKNNLTVLRVIFLGMLFSLLGFSGAISQEKNLDKEAWQEIIKEYDYGELDEIPQEDKKEEEKENDESKTQSGWNWKLNPEVTKVIAICTVIVILTLLVLQLMGIKIYHRKIERQKYVDYDGLNSAKDEMKFETQFEKDLRKALKNKNYREAIRIYFVTIMIEMAHEKWVKLEKDKTNRDYVRELRGKKEQKTFRELVRLFDLVWYGDILLTQEEYQRLAPAFAQFLNKIPKQNG